MSRNGKKGFKRLNTHELVELNRNGRDSGSESELFDVTTIDEHEPRRGGYCGCCCWFGILYVGLLTILVLLIGAFSGYVFITSLQSYQECNTTSNELRDTIKKLREDFETHSKHVYYVLDGIKETTFLSNNSFFSVSAAMNGSLLHLEEERKELDHRLTVIESNPQEVLIKQVDTIHNEMAVLDKNMDMMNHSLNELHEMREQMASLGSTLNSYESKFNTLSSDIGDVVHDNTDLQDVMQGFSDKIQNFSDRIDGMETNLTLEHSRMNQSLNSTSLQFSDLRTMMVSINESMSGEMVEMLGGMTEMKTNMTEVGSILKDMSNDMSGLSANISSLSESVHNLTMELELVNSTLSYTLSHLPPPPPPSPSEMNVAATTENVSGGDTMLNDDPSPIVPGGGDAKSEDDTVISENTGPSMPGGGDAKSDDDTMISENTSPSMPGGGDAKSDDDTMISDSTSPSMPGGSDATTSGEPVPGTTPSQPGNSTTSFDSTKATEDIPRTGSDEAAPSAPQVIQGILDNFDRYDVNKDGALDLDEFLLFTPGNDRSNSRIFVLLDTNKNMELERSELERTLAMLLAKDDENGGKSS